MHVLDANTPEFQQLFGVWCTRKDDELFMSVKRCEELTLLPGLTFILHPELTG